MRPAVVLSPVSYHRVLCSHCLLPPRSMAAFRRTGPGVHRFPCPLSPQIAATDVCAGVALWPAGLSAYVPLHKEQPVFSEANAKTPIFMGHGDADQTVSSTGQYGDGLGAAARAKRLHPGRLRVGCLMHSLAPYWCVRASSSDLAASGFLQMSTLATAGPNRGSAYLLPGHCSAQVTK